MAAADVAVPAGFKENRSTASFSMRRHSASLTGITDSREIRTSAKSLNAASALISFSVTGRASFFTGATSTTAALPVLSFGSA